MPDLITPRIRGTFRASASAVVLADISRMWENEGFVQAGFVDGNEGMRVTRWREFEAGVVQSAKELIHFEPGGPHIAFAHDAAAHSPEDIRTRP